MGENKDSEVKEERGVLIKIINLLLVNKSYRIIYAKFKICGLFYVIYGKKTASL